MGRAIFTSNRPLERAENLKAVWDAYDGDKEFSLMLEGGTCHEAEHAEELGYTVIVADEFLQHPIVGKSRVKYVHVSHGAAAGKTYGLDQACRYISEENGAQVDYYITSSVDGIGVSAGQAGIPEDRCLPLGMPRTDWYFGKSKGDGGTPLSECVTAYLYAPSFRAEWWEPPMPKMDWARVSSLLDEDETLFVKRHMCTTEPIVDEDYPNIVELSPDVPSAPYIIDCDVLGTDYSTILVDGYICGKPAMLFCPDWREYCEKRGMYLAYPDDYCSVTSTDELSFVEAFRCARGYGMGRVERRCLEIMAGSCDGHSAERVADLVRSLA